MTHEQSRHTVAGSFCCSCTGCYLCASLSPFVTSHLLFGPFLDNVHIYGPIFAEVSRLSLSGAVPYYLPDIGTGFPVFESPHFSILYPFYFFGLINYGGPLNSLYTLTYLTLFHIFIFYVNLYVLLRCGTVPPWAAYIGASVGMLARNTELYASWITITASYAWLPLVLAGGVLLFRFPGKAHGIVVFSVAAGLLALASASQSGYSYRPELSDTVRRRYRLVVSRATLFRYLAGSLVSGAMRRDCVRAGRGRDSPNVHGHW